jgi:hypothetical protein
MELELFYVARRFKDGRIEYDSGPYRSWFNADRANETEHRWNAKEYIIVKEIREVESY